MPKKTGSRNLTTDFRRLIAECALRLHDDSRESVQLRLFASLQGKFASLPEASTVRQMISAARNMKNPLDEDWSPSSLAKHPIPAQDLPAVVHAYAHRQHAHGRQHPSQEPHFTIREAIWVARIHGLFGEEPSKIPEYAAKYAFRERVSEAARVPFDPSDIDAELMEYLGNIGKKGRLQRLGEKRWEGLSIAPLKNTLGKVAELGLPSPAPSAGQSRKQATGIQYQHPVESRLLFPAGGRESEATS
jgi:hypothetical protein